MRDRDSFKDVDFKTSPGYGEEDFDELRIRQTKGSFFRFFFYSFFFFFFF